MKVECPICGIMCFDSCIDQEKEMAQHMRNSHGCDSLKCELKKIREENPKLYKALSESPEPISITELLEELSLLEGEELDKDKKKLGFRKISDGCYCDKLTNGTKCVPCMMGYEK